MGSTSGNTQEMLEATILEPKDLSKPLIDKLEATDHIPPSEELSPEEEEINSLCCSGNPRGRLFGFILACGFLYIGRETVPDYEFYCVLHDVIQ